MKTPVLYSFLCIWLVLTISACNSDDQANPQLRLEAIGFSGTLPDGRTFGEKGVLSDNNLVSSASSAEGSYISHVLSVLDSTAGVSIEVELPYIKFSDNYNTPNDSIVDRAAKDYYPYPVVKEKLSVGNKFILSSQAPEPVNNFRVMVVDQKDYVAFTSEGTDQDNSYLKVIELIEGTATDPDRGSVKTMEVVFDLDVKLYEQSSGQSGKLTGLLRMKYWE